MLGDNEAGSWRLSLSTGLDIETLGYIRTEDGFVTAMHEVARTTRGADGETLHHVPFFDPGYERSQVKPSCVWSTPTFGTPTSRSPAATTRESTGSDEVRLSLPGGTACWLGASGARVRCDRRRWIGLRHHQRPSGKWTGQVATLARRHRRRDPGDEPAQESLRASHQSVRLRRRKERRAHPPVRPSGSRLQRGTARDLPASSTTPMWPERWRSAASTTPGRRTDRSPWRWPPGRRRTSTPATWSPAMSRRVCPRAWAMVTGTGALRLTTELNIEALAYIRTRGRFRELRCTRSRIRHRDAESGTVHYVPFFEPRQAKRPVP